MIMYEITLIIRTFFRHSDLPYVKTKGSLIQENLKVNRWWRYCRRYKQLSCIQERKYPHRKILSLSLWLQLADDLLTSIKALAQNVMKKMKKSHPHKADVRMTFQ